MGKYYIYRFLDKNENVLYVGKTKNIERRMASHFSSSNVSLDEWKNDVKNIEFVKFKNPYEMSIGEIYFIGKYKPKYNKEFMEKYELGMMIDIYEHIEWKSYSDIKTYTNNEYDFFKQITKEERRKMMSMINVYEGKENYNYFKKNNKEEVLSDYWISRNHQGINQLRKNIINIIQNKLKLKSDDILCLTTEESIGIMKDNSRYKKTTIPIWSDPIIATDKRFIAYVYNGYLLEVNKDEYNNDLYKIVNLLQFIWRSRIREGKPIDLYIPSRRMRDLLYDYLEGRI